MDTIYCDLIVNGMIKEIDDYKTATAVLSDRSSYSMYQTIQDNATHQNREFLTPLDSEAIADGLGRDFYDIVTPMTETGVDNSDIDTDNIGTYVDNRFNIGSAYFASVILRNYFRQTNFGEEINDNLYFLFDDGNLLLRHLEGNDIGNGGKVSRRVMPQNIIVTDITAEDPEHTTIIEKNIMTQQEVREMNWNEEAKKKVFELCNVGSTIPFFDVYYRYGEQNKKTFGMAMSELGGTYSPKDGDEKEYPQTISVLVRPKTGTKDVDNREVKGVLVFAEELKPKEYKITSKLKIKRYKPYEMVRLGKFNGRFWGEGYREKGRPYQNRANEIANQLREAMDLASKMLFWSTDETAKGKNVLSSLKQGDILHLKDLQLLNNVFPNLSLYASEWNRNIQECQKTLKAFEVATGETMPSSTSATAIGVQNTQIGKYHNFKREIYGLFISRIVKMWFLPDLIKIMKDREFMELTGDTSFIDEVIDSYVNGLWNINVLDIYRAMIRNINVPVPTQENEQLFKEIQKQRILKEPKLYMEAHKEYLENVEFFVGIDITGEGFNKQAKISNALAMLQYETDENEKQDTINWVKMNLGLPVKRYRKPQMQQQPQPSQPNQPQPSQAPQSTPMKEQPENPNML